MQLLLNKSFVAFAAVVAVQMQLTNAIGAYFCNDNNWTNDCAHWTALTAGKCYTLDAGHQNSISSFGPDEGIFCDVYTDYHCTNECMMVYHPGYASLNFNGGDGGQNCNDRVNSFACWAIPT